MANERPDIGAAANKAQSIEADGVKVNRHKLKDLIEADEYLAGQEAVKKPKTLFRPMGFGGTQ